MTRTTDALSRRDYDCIASVQTLSFKGWPARVKDVAARMKVTPPTAVGFLDKLVGQGFVEKGTTGYRLTGKGTRYFDDVTRTHRLLETLFSRNGIALDEACRISASMVGIIPESDLEKLCATMSHPATCPHGRPIPVGAHHG